jgi:hypothetical protein
MLTPCRVPSEVPLVSVSLAGALATLAFLVVFNALINDFFWIDISKAPLISFHLKF